VTVRVLTPVPGTPRLRTPSDLVEALGLPFSEQQLAAITTPREPGVIIAGAGSGKTTVMAARVVVLHMDGLPMRRRMMVEKSWDVYPDSEPSLAFRRRAINAVEAVIARHPGERVAERDASASWTGRGRLSKSISAGRS